jgi:hypothetical protein
MSRSGFASVRAPLWIGVLIGVAIWVLVFAMS